jgi:hypothetical protein
MISTTKTILLFALYIACLPVLAQDADFELVSVNSNFEAANAVAMDQVNSAIYVGGTIKDGDEIQDFLGYESSGTGIGDMNLQGGGSEDCYLAKLSYDGEILWLLTFGSDKKDELFDIAIGPDFNVYITGAYEDEFGMPSIGSIDVQNVPVVSSFSGYDMYTASFTPDGVLRWIETDGGDGDDQGLSIDVGDDGIAVLGVYKSDSSTWSLGGQTAGYTSNTSDFSVVKRDFSGSPIWSCTMVKMCM